MRTWGELCRNFGARVARTAREAGLIEDVMPGTYCRAGLAEDFMVRAHALALHTEPDGLLTGLAAAYAWGVYDETPERITMQVPRHWHVQAPGWARLLRVPHAGRQFRWNGLPLVSAADAVVQVWREARPDVGIAVVIAAVQRRKATVSALLEALDRRKRMPRRARLEELLAVVGTEVTSYLEYIAWRDVFPPRLFRSCAGRWKCGRTAASE